MSLPQIWIVVVSDNICPWCYVGKKSLDQAILQFQNKANISVLWKPFFLRRDLPKHPQPGINLVDYIEQVYGIRKDLSDPENPLNKMGTELGIKFNYERTMINTLDSHRLVNYARKYELQNETIQKIFYTYFEEGKNISDISVLTQIGNSVGLPKVEEYLNSDQDNDLVISEDTWAKRERRISGVPYFMFYNKNPHQSKTLPRPLFYLSGGQPVQRFLSAFENMIDN